MIASALAIVLTASQLHWATIAYQLGEPHGLGYALVALEGQESSYCKFKVNKWSRGCLGIKRSTARLFDSQVTRRQLTDDNARNIRDGLAYLLYCRANTAGWSEMVYCYHYGLPGEIAVKTEWQIVNDGYVKAVKRRMHEIKVTHD